MMSIPILGRTGGRLWRDVWEAQKLPGASKRSQMQRLLYGFLQFGGRLPALIALIGQALHDDGFHFWRNVRVEQTRWPLMEGKRRLQARVAGGEQLMQHGSQGIDVAARVHKALVLLRRRVSFGADHGIASLWLNNLGDTKIDEHGLVLGGEHHVGGFEITENHRKRPKGVQIFEYAA